jgi:hypothetical protein
MAFGDEDLDQIFSESDPFAVLASFDINGNGNDPIEVYGEFTEANETVDLLSGQPIAFDKSFTCRTSEVSTVKREMTVDIGGTTYTVKQKQNVGTGVTLVLLKT